MLGFNTVAITFGRFNPPSTGHQLLLKKVKEASETHRIFFSKTKDNSKNPLTWERKLYWLKKIFPNYNLNNDPTLINIFNVLPKLVDEGYNNVILVVGSDRVTEFETSIRPYLTNPDPNKRIWLANFEVRSAGERDPDAEDVSGISASKLRKYAVEDNFQMFAMGVPNTITEFEKFDLFNEIKKELGAKEKVKKVIIPKGETPTGQKNLHLEHLEDQIIDFGIDGGNKSISFLKSLTEMLQGNSSSKVNVTVKWDGAPAIICGINPENGKFFVGTKSVFATGAKINYTENDILLNHGYGSGLTEKLKIALRYFPELGIKNVIQGDMMFTSQDLKQQTIDNKPFITFRPNTILYAVDPDSGLGQKIKGSKIGVVFHTVYNGKKLSQMSASFNFNINSLKTTKNVWAADAYFNNQSGEATFNKMETQQINTMITSCETILHQINKPLIDFLTKNKKMKELFKVFLNKKIRENQPILVPETFSKDLIQFIKERFGTDIDKLKTVLLKEKLKKQKEDTVTILENNIVDLNYIFKFMAKIVDAKLFILKKLQKVKSIGTFIQTEDGFKVTAPEGFVAIDVTTNNAIKIVDRLEFSRENFTATKDWVKGT